jgi:hypothetical protein
MRYRYDTGAILDNQTGEILTDVMVRNRLNQQDKEIKELKKQLESEHQQLKNAILLERTRMGQNALKQYKEAIM